MRRFRLPVVIGATVITAGLVTAGAPGRAQPAKGAPAAFERVREVMLNRFKDEKLSDDPDQNFAAMLIASYEQLIFLSKTQLEYGGDRQLREVAQKIQDDEQKQIDDIKQWQVRSRVAGYKAQPDQSPPGTGPLDQQAQAVPAEAPVQAKPGPAEPSAQSAAPKVSSNAPMVSATIKKLDETTGKVTLDHERIPNVDMDAMTMAYKVQDPATLKGLKAGDKVRFNAEDVNGQITVIKIQKAR